MTKETLDLNRQIAEELGYTVKWQGRLWVAYDLSGDVIIKSGNKDQVWLWVLTNHDLPDWAHSVDAALTLPIPDGYIWRLIQYGDKTWHVQLDDTKRNLRVGSEFSETSLAEAICRAWLSYRAAQKGGEK